MVDDRIFFRPVEIRWQVEKSVQIGLTVARLYGDRHWRLPARRAETRDIGRLERDDCFSIEVAQYRYRRRVGLRVGIDEVLAGWREGDFVIGVFRSQQRESRSVYPNLVELTEVRITPALLSASDKPDRSACLVDATELRDVPFAAGDLALELAGGEIVQIELAPVVALREPDHFVRCRQNAPVDGAVAGFVLGRDIFAKDVTHGSSPGIGDAKHLVLVIARGRDESNVRSIGIPFDVGPFRTATDYVIAERGAMCVGWHLESYHARGIDVDHYALDRRDDAVARQRILPRL